MDKAEITKKLDILYGKKHQLQLLEARLEAELDAATPDEVKEKLAEIRAELEPSIDMAEDNIALLTSEIVEMTKEVGDSVQGKYFKCVYNPGGKTVAAKDILDYANKIQDAHPNIAIQIRSLVTQKKDSASVQAVK